MVTKANGEQRLLRKLEVVNVLRKNSKAAGGCCALARTVMEAGVWEQLTCLLQRASLAQASLNPALSDLLSPSQLQRKGLHPRH